MSSDYVQLSWNADYGHVLPAGSYITHKGEMYSLLEDYSPSMSSEREFRYTPQFHSRVVRWQKTLIPVYTYEDDGVTVKTREFDWTFTGTPADAMYMVEQALLHETGEKWTMRLGDDLPETIELSSQASSVWDILSEIADRCKTEWWTDKASNDLYLLACSRGASYPLEVGRNVGVPSVTSNTQEGYYTRFYAFGSTRNITESDSVVMGSIINKRLTLDPKKYPHGYKDIKGHFDNGAFVSDLAPAEVFPTPLYFEDIYPSSRLTISDVRKRMKYRLDDEGEKVRKGGTEENPEYEQYAIWYFQIPNFEFSEELIIKNQTLSVNFKSGLLRGREFELAYHKEAKKIAGSDDVDEEFAVKAGDYEIIFDEVSEGFIIPSVDYLIPENGDEVVLFNIEMPKEYTDSAMLDLEAELDKEIEKRRKDNNSYEFNSNPVAFYREGMSMSVGQKVSFSYKGKTLDTRVLMVEKHLDYEFEQKIRIGNEVIKGSRQRMQDAMREVGSEVNRLNEISDNAASVQRDQSRSLALTMGRYYAMQNTINMLQSAFKNFSEGINPVTVQTMGLLVGDESLQFKFISSIGTSVTPINIGLSYKNETKTLKVSRQSRLMHMTLGIDSITAPSSRGFDDYKRWAMPAWESGVLDDAEKSYYFYARVPVDGTSGEFLLSEASIGMNDESGYYHLLIGILNSEYADTREFVSLYGFTEILPARITTDKIVSADGNAVLDLVEGLLTFGDKVGLSASEGAEENLRIWAGSEAENKDIAPFRVYDNGKVFASLLHLLNGCTIGDSIRIEDGRMVIDIPDNNAKVTISEDGVVAEGFCTAAIGHCGGAGVQGFANGAPLTCPNVDGGVGVHGDAPNEGYAFWSTSGKFGGMRPNTRVITQSGDTTSRTFLTEVDFSVMVYLASGVCYLRLPLAPQDGQEYHIESHGATLNILASQPTWISKSKSVVYADTPFTHDGSGILRLKFYKQINQWQCSVM